ncbi:MAG: SRPBCC family protein [Aeromicrobium erythreum]
MAKTPTANRERIESSIEIDAPPAAVWDVVSDLRRMGEWSPQCKKMIIRGGEVREGTRTFNLNRQGWKWWPTRSYVKVFEPQKRLVLKIAENGTLWSYELEPTATGTRLTEARLAPNGVSKVSKLLTEAVLGGTERFEDELQRGIEQTLAKIKVAAERG